MKIICLKNNFKEAIMFAEKTTGKNPTLPILNNVLIYTDNNILKIRTTNLEIGTEIIIPAKIEKKGKVAVPANLISSFLSSFSDNENITMESINDNLSVSTSNTSILIKGCPANDFPDLPVIKEKKSISIKTKDFLEGFKSVWYSVSFSNIKPEISSIYIMSDKKNPLTFVATDSFRLAKKKFSYKFSDNFSLLIPYKNAVEIMRILENKEEKTELTIEKNQILIVCGNVKIVSRITEGVFPDYKQIIPDKFITDVILEKQIFLSSLKTAGIFSGKLNEINFIVNPENKFITISTSNFDTGEYTTNVPANITGEEIKITFNYKYIIDCLSFVPSKKIILRFSGQGRPLLVAGIDDDTFQYIVMPMNN